MSLLRNHEFIFNIIKICFLSGVSYFTMAWMLRKLDPSNSEQRNISKLKGKSQLEKIGKAKVELSEHELMISANLIAPVDINVSFKDIAGLKKVLNDLFETVIFPIRHRKMLKSALSTPPKGILLHGPPGCGKTLIAKATVKEAGIAFLSLDISLLTDKWFGESQKMVSALFSLAEKLEPCVIFIDEIDSFLRNRSMNDHETTAMMKAQFMSLWDGMQTATDKYVVIMGATNRPQDLDAAILRRMPSTFYIPMPNRKARSAILKLMLEKENTEEIDLDDLAAETHGFSGSDLKQLCRISSSYRVREYATQAFTAERRWKEDKDVDFKLRPLTMQDMVRGLDAMRSSEIG